MTYNPRMVSILVVTGGPCAGKTTLITRLGELGHPILPEAAAEVIIEGIHHPSRDPVAFQREVLRRQLGREATAPEGTVFSAYPGSTSSYHFPLTGMMIFPVDDIGLHSSAPLREIALRSAQVSERTRSLATDGAPIFTD